MNSTNSCNMLEKAYFIVNLVFSVISGVMAICFLAFPSPEKEELKNYRISLRFLSGAFAAMTILTLAILIFDINDNSKELFSFLSILIASTQALLFSFTLIILFNPHFIKRAYLLKHVLPLILLSVLYVISSILYGDPCFTEFKILWHNMAHPTLIVRLLFFLFYGFQLVYYSNLFFKEEHKYKDELNNYYSDVRKLQLSWVRYAFISALIIGILSLISNFFPYRIYDICFTSILAVYYLIVALEYIKYNNIYEKIEPAITNPIIIQEQSIIIPKSKSNWITLKQQIIDNKYFLQTSVNIEDIAGLLNIGRTTLSNYINTEECMNFNSFINTLRIEEAKRLLLNNPDLSIAHISDSTGFSEQANFSRQFKLITGESPLLWRRKHVNQRAVA